MPLLSRGFTTISDLCDGRILYTRSHFQPATPAGASPAGWNADAGALNTLPTGAPPNVVQGNMYGTLWASTLNPDTELWSTPYAAEAHLSNPYLRYPFVEGTGNMTATLGGVARTIFTQSSGSINTRLLGTTPYGTQGILWQGTVNDVGATNSWVGGIYNNAVAQSVPIDPTKWVRISVWAKRDANTTGSFYFGYSPSAAGYLEVYTVAGGWAANSNHYMLSGTKSSIMPRAEEWMLYVGYILPQNAEPVLASTTEAGIYVRATGQRIYTPGSTTYVARLASGNTVAGIRVAQYNILAPHNNDTIWLYDPRVEVCDGREPSITDLLRTPVDFSQYYTKTETNTRFTQTDTAIALKADKTVTDSLGTRLSTAEGKITIESNRITNAVTQFTEDIGSLNETAQSLSDDASALVTRMSEQLLATLASQYGTKQDILALNSAVSSLLTQTASEIELVFQRATTYAVQMTSGMQTYIDTLQAYQRFSVDGLELGALGSPFVAKLGTTRLSFLQGGQEVAYLSNNKLFITSAQVTTKFSIGSDANGGYFDLVTTAQGLALKWRAG